MRAIVCGIVLGALAFAMPVWAQGKTEPVQKPAAKSTVPAAPAAKPGSTAPAKSAPAPATTDPKDTPKDTPMTAADAADATTGEASEGSGLPIPRFVSLRAETINMRSGPGIRYPVDWVYRRRHLPVEVIAEFDTWRRIRDPDGAEGWVHQSMITGRRTAVVRGTLQPLHRADGDEGHPVAILQAGVIVNVLRCPTVSLSCRVEINGFQGWLKREQLWGVYPTEKVE